jgi:cytochrome c oxidase subunit 2
MIPAFGVKQDAIPGFVRDTWFRAERTGDFYGQCAELCGKEHAYMPIHVKVVSEAQYTDWVTAEKKKLAALADDPSKEWKLQELIARGEKVYAANCAACHQASGKGGGAIKALDGSPVVQDADRGKQVMVLLNGQNNGAMPSWKQLSDTEIAAVITYTKNSWSNKTGQLVQPSEVAGARQGKALAGGSTTAAAPAAAAEPAAAPAAPAADTSAAAPAAVAADAGLPIKVLFDSGKSQLDADAQKAVANAVTYLKDHADTKVALSGYVDASGNAAANAELAKDRAKNVRAALTEAGVAQDRIELRKPSQIEAGAASQDNARRVEIVAVK